MKTEVKTPVIVAIVAAFVLLVGFAGFKVIGNAGNLDHGQISYTPGVPPWLQKDPTKKGVAGLGSGGPGAAPTAQR